MGAFVDLKEQKIGMLSILYLDDTRKAKNGSRYWICKCDCGRFVSKRQDLIHKSPHCGCISNKKNLLNKKINLFTVTKQIPFFDYKKYGIRAKKSTAIYWECVCECGTSKYYPSARLNSNCAPYCCGCLYNEDGHHSWIGYQEIPGRMLSYLRRNALSRDLEYNISDEYIWQIFLKQERKCVLTGREIRFPNKNEDFGTASLDRIDNTKGYVEGNIQWVHKEINWFKNKLDVNKFVELCQEVTNYQKTKS